MANILYMPYSGSTPAVARLLYNTTDYSFTRLSDVCACSPLCVVSKNPSFPTWCPGLSSSSVSLCSLPGVPSIPSVHPHCRRHLWQRLVRLHWHEFQLHSSLSSARCSLRVEWSVVFILFSEAWCLLLQSVVLAFVGCSVGRCCCAFHRCDVGHISMANG